MYSILYIIYTEYLLFYALLQSLVAIFIIPLLLKTGSSIYSIIAMINQNNLNNLISKYKT